MCDRASPHRGEVGQPLSVLRCFDPFPELVESFPQVEGTAVPGEDFSFNPGETPVVFGPVHLSWLISNDGDASVRQIDLETPSGVIQSVDVDAP